jgi:hypothetical protein
LAPRQFKHNILGLCRGVQAAVSAHGAAGVPRMQVVAGVGLSGSSGTGEGGAEPAGRTQWLLPNRMLIDQIKQDQEVGVQE